MYSKHKSKLVKLTQGLQEQIKKLTHYTVIGSFVLGSTISFHNQALAADGDAGGTEIADTNALTSSALTGLKESNATAAVAITITSNTTAEFGVNGDDDALTIDSGDDEQITVTTAGTGTVIFAGDIDLDGAGDQLDINVQTIGGTTIVENNVKEDDASVTDFIVGKAGGTDSSFTLAFDNASDENQALATIDNIVGVDASDTSIVAFRSSGADSADNTSILSGVLGGSGAAIIQQVNVGDTDGQTVLVEYNGTAVTVGAITLGNGGSTADAVTLTVDISTNADITVAGTIDGAATDTTTLAIDGDDGNTNTFSGDIGVTTALTNVLIGSNEDNVDTTTVFNGSLKASAITIGNTNASNNDIYVVTFTNAAAETISGVISEAAAADTTTVNIAEAAGDDAAATLVTVENTVTVDSINVGSASAGGSTKFSDAVTATMVTVDGGDDAAEKGLIDFAANMTGEVNIDDNTGTSVVTYSGSAATTQTGVVHSVTANDGKILVSNTVGTTFTANIGTDGAVGELEVGASGIGIFEDIVDVALVDLDGHMTVQENNNTATNFTLADGATLIIDDTIVDGEKVFLASTTLVAASIVNTGEIKLPSNLSNGQTLELFETVGSGSGVSTLVVEDTNAVLADTAIRDYIATETGTRDVTVTVVDRSSADIGAQLGTTSNDGAALLQATIAASGDATLLDLFTNVLNEEGFSATADTTLAKQLAPQTDLISGSSVAAQSVTGSIQGIMSNRMASLRSGDAYFGTGVAAGGMSAKSGFIQVFGSTAEQKSTKVGSGTQAGFDSDTQGVAIGFDGISDEGMTVGVSVATANTDVDGKGTGKSVNSIDTYSASLYMDTATDNGYFEGSLTFGVNENSTTRKLNTAGLSRTYTGSYDSQSLSLNLAAGMPSEVGAGYLTPFGSFTASSMNIDAYTEKSTVADDAFRLKVAQDDINSMIGTVGVKFHAEMDNGGMPMISLAINNEFGDSTIDSNNTFQGGGSVFKTSTAVEELSATLGLGYTYDTDAASIEFAYEADANDDKYLSHYGTIKIVGKF
jgi:uncharacterized protein with beta-barrel porin domain